MAAIDRRRGARAGFTLLELIVVMAMIAVITMAIVPVYAGSMVAITLRNARADFLAVLRHTQERAVAESLEYRLYIDDKEGRYWAAYLAEAEDDRKFFEPVEEEFGRETAFPSYLTIERMKAPKDRESGFHYIGCYPTGASDRVTLTIQDTRARNRRMKIATLGALGKVEVDE